MREAYALAREGKPSLIYPVGYAEGQSSATSRRVTGFSTKPTHFCDKHKVAIDTAVQVPGSLMSYRDPHAMLECLFYVNELPGGEAHHDGGMKGRDHAAALANPMLQAERRRDRPRSIGCSSSRSASSSRRRGRRRDRRTWCSSSADVAGIALPGTDKPVSRACRIGSGLCRGREEVSRSQCFFVSCDLNPSTKLGKAAALVPAGHSFEMSIQEQAATLMTDGLSFVADRPQLNVFATFAAFMEGIAREGFEFWRYQRNLNGANEGLNVLLHFAHVGANTGRDHFSGWSLDWINLGARLSAVPASLLRAGRCARGLHRRTRCRRALRRSHRRHSARHPAGADQAGQQRARCGRPTSRGRR